MNWVAYKNIVYPVREVAFGPVTNFTACAVTTHTGLIKTQGWFAGDNLAYVWADGKLYEIGLRKFTHWLLVIAWCVAGLVFGAIVGGSLYSVSEFALYISIPVCAVLGAIIGIVDLVFARKADRELQNRLRSVRVP
jgi:hypothetical protein